MKRLPFEMDLETYRNYFLCKFFDGNQFYDIPMWPGYSLDIQQIVNILSATTTYTFNGINYDMPILTLAMHGADCEALKRANDAIIMGGVKWWDFYRNYGIQIPEYVDHVDLMEVAPGVRIGLKMYMGRLHAPKMQDLPFVPDAELTPMDRFNTARYCGNDLVGTRMLRLEIAERLTLREDISARYGIDVRSKSDAQIAEAVVKSRLEFIPDKRYIPHGYQFQYAPPAFIQFASPQMQQLLDVVRNAWFVVTDKEEAYELGFTEPVRTGVNIPPELKDRDIRIGGSVYRMGIGGLHSQESDVMHRTIPGVQKIKDVDVTSYYPSLILAMNMYPSQLGPAFIAIYRAIYAQRLEAKAAGRNAESDGLKIVLNGTFGKLFSKYSIFYAPEFGIATTLTGQLALLMLIEMMEMSGIGVVSANTDGIVLRIPEGRDTLAAQIIAWWEARTGFRMEDNNYTVLAQRDVNNYIAITDKGKVKRKGVFNQGGVLSGPQGKGPDKDICADAVVEFLQHGTPIEQTIRACQDIRKFLVIRAVKGGGVWVPPPMLDMGTPDGGAEYLGKAVRWYHSRRWRGAYIAYQSNGNRVAGSMDVAPCMDLPATFPDDIDYDHYIQVACEMIKEWQ